MSIPTAAPANRNSPPRHVQHRSSELQITWRIVAVVSLTALCYLTIGLPLAVLPGFVHLDLGYSPVLAGAAISVQYIATLVTRPLAGRSADTRGPKRTVFNGLLACGASGILLLGAAPAASHELSALSFALLVTGRLLLGFGESCCATGCTTWGIGRVGMQNSARVISWNGIATYGALAAAAPLGVELTRRFGFGSLGLVVVVIGALGAWITTRVEAVAVVGGERIAFRQVVALVMPCGLGLALGSVGFGSIATFITLFYAQRGWANAALTLTVFGMLFVGTRLVFARGIPRYGGFRVAIVSFTVESLGLLVLWRAGDPLAALGGAALAGAGFALIFPALGVEAIDLVPAGSRGAALSAYSVFLDLALGVTGPLAGLVAGSLGYASVYCVAAAAAALGVALTVGLWLRTSQGASPLRPSDAP